MAIPGVSGRFFSLVPRYFFPLREKEIAFFQLDPGLSPRISRRRFPPPLFNGLFPSFVWLLPLAEMAASVELASCELILQCQVDWDSPLPPILFFHSFFLGMQ